ncbi:hypothetical protein EWM57_04505 [Hymenobacter persicinus]|uniref:Uncharacterized protein n=2 Tax=Hymenobacter persicinus TaxID=2025506 RepID=A0A4Q5LEH0_9BACT|nr:hypothetical protein EWM57_04505 [Hymenobacter persicinus]
MKKLYFLLLALLFMVATHYSWAQSADMPRHGTSLTGLNDPEPANPRYLNAGVLAQLQHEQLPPPVDTLLEEPTSPSATPPSPPAPALPGINSSLRKQ